MMLRYLQPDCQCLVKKCELKDLPFIGVYIPLKNTNFAMAELRRLENRHASDILNEHIMVTHFCVKIFENLAKPNLYSIKGDMSEVKRYYFETFLPSVGLDVLMQEDLNLDDDISIAELFSKMSHIMESVYRSAMSYTKRLAFSQELIPYNGPLYDYMEFLVPVLTNLIIIPSFTKGTIYLLIDDAQCLTDTQTRVLNSWVATRTSRKISLKISTQYNYKTYYTSAGATIDTPHDYSEIDMATIYTGSSKSKYRDRIKDIVERRLKATGINIPVEDFFPEDTNQENQIRKIAETYRIRYDNGESRGHNRSDDALRYSRPDFIKGLAGVRKSSSTYSYAGFNQLVHLSSGVIRHFLHPAHLMYAKTKSQQNDVEINFISPTIQDEIVREEANSFLFNDLDKMEQEGHEYACPKEDIIKLSKLIQGLGGLFRQKLLSNQSERRVFSIAISDQTSDEVGKTLDLGVQLGYFHRSTIGRKENKSGGRTKLYVMNRRLAPIWNLDPTGFAGYLFMKNKVLGDAIIDPRSMLNRINKSGEFDDIEFVQLSLFDDIDEPQIDVIGEEEYSD